MKTPTKIVPSSRDRFNTDNQTAVLLDDGLSCSAADEEEMLPPLWSAGIMYFSLII